MGTVTITEGEYAHLMQCKRINESLLDEGVNNWEGYYAAMSKVWESEADLGLNVRNFVLVDPREYDAAVEDAALYRDLCT